MKSEIRFISISCLLMVVFGYQNVDAQQNLAQEAYAIFEQSCLICHGENGSNTEALIIEHTALIDDGKVIPGNPEGSVFYQRLIETDVAKRMPRGQPALDAASIETIRQWIAAGAPDWDAVPRPDTDFITTNAMLETIENHVNSLSSSDRSFARYFTLTHLYNAGETTEALQAYRRALSKLINSLSWGREVVKPQPIDAEETLFYIDLRDYEWDVRNDAWTQIEQVYPYKMTFDAPTQTPLREKLTTLQQKMSCEVPFVHVDWFLAAASLPPLYHDILALPQTDRELEEELRVFVTANLQNAPGERVWRAGFNESGVSRHNRVVERHTSSYGAYWKSYDFAGSAESQNIFTHPLDFIHDGGEIIFSLPNGLQAYYLVDANGGRLDVAPTDIVSDPAASDPAVRNGLSCIGCHTQGMKTFEDEVRAVVDQAANPPFDKARALDLYVEKTVMDGLVEEDTLRYREALEAAGGVFGGIEPIQRFYEVFHGSLGAAHAAASVGLETDVFLEKISKNVSLQNLLGVLVLEDGTVKRDAWTSNFHDVIAALNTPDSVLPPVVERPEIIPGAGVYIPDANLRIAIAEALGKASGDEITVEDMETLTEFYAEGLGIENITGIEFAINLEVLQIRGNMIVDILPISKLTKLSLLRIADNNISEISAIAGLTNISSLEIYANEISDITPLGGLTNMRWLSMYDNPVSDLSPLRNMQWLQGMRVTVAPPGDLSPLAELVNLTRIYYWSGYPIADLSPLAKLPKLRFIEIAGGQADLTPLAKATALEHFVYFGPTPDLSPLTNLSHLFKIEIWDGENPDLSSLARAIGLKELWVSRCGISNLSFLENLTGLERLNLEGNNISDVSPLAGLTNLKWLKLTNNPITDFSSLEELSKTTNIIIGEVAIPDRYLRAAIADALGKADTAVVSITADEMMTLTYLDVRNWIDNEPQPQRKYISNLTGLEFAINLNFLHIHSNSVSDLSPLAGLTKLSFLDAQDNSISDISPLAGLNNLKGLILKGNLISDISPLTGLTNLENLRVNGNFISDYSPITNLTSLKEVWISNTSLSDLSLLAGLNNLEGVHVWDAPVKDLSSLAGLTKLRWLNFGRTPISDLVPLTNLTNLRKLTFYDCGIQDEDLSFLAGLKELTFLKIPHNTISDLSPLEGLTQLSYLELGNNMISDVSSLAGLTNLVTLWIDNNEISGVSSLAGLTNLQELNLRNNPITDFSQLSELFENTNILFDVTIPDLNLRAAIVEDLRKEDMTAPITLAEMATLTTLTASNKDIKDLTGIEYAINLQEIWIGNNPLFNLLPVERLTNLTGLSAWETPISDLSALKDLTKLRWLDFGRTDVYDLSPLKGKTSLKKLKFYGCGDIKDLSPLTGLTELTELNFGGNPISDLSPLVTLINLEHLDFHGDDITNLSPLTGLNNLKHLDLRANSLSDVSALAGLTSLTNLLLGDNKISDVSPLAGLINLEYLFLRENLITDIAPLNNLHKDIYIDWLRNPGAPKEGPKLEGPWLCVLIPGKRLDNTTDFLADTSDGSVTEHQIATNGATQGKAVGDNKWTSHKISPIGRNNFKDVLRTFGVPPDQDTSDNVVYACIILGSQQEQNTKLLLGSEGHHKIWLNGDLIHQDVGLDVHDSRDYGMFFPVTLKQGANIILVAIDSGHWITGHFGFEEGAEYTVIPPDMVLRPSFSASETNVLTGDTFTLNLNAENITDLAGWQADIAFDPNVLEAIEVTEGDFLKSEGDDTFFQAGTIDNAAGKITSLYSARISESGVSGTGSLLSVTFMAKAGGETQVTLENFEFISITDDIIPAVPPNISITVGEYPAWDVNQDGRVSIQDLILVARDLGSNAPANLRTDVNRDGEINIQDLILVARHIGESTDSSAAPTIFAIDSEELMPEMIKTWIEQAQTADDGSIAFRQGIENLQRLLASLIPEKTALLANYPNPFNPETWIPYHLAKPADVTLTIYDTNGSVVRTIALGYQNAGVYQSRSRAAYWDGRNAVGEPAASSIYFYTLTAGDYTATRKMLILK